MTISRIAKKEISSPPLKSCCKRARFSAALKTAGSMHIASDGIKVQLSTDNLALAEFASAYVLERYGADVKPASSKHITVTFSGDYTQRLLVEAGIFSGEKGGLVQIAGIASFLTRGACCVKEYVKGAFLGCGFVASDISHLEFAFNLSGAAEDFAELISPLCVMQLSTRNEKHIVYSKNRSDICDILAYMEASTAVIRASEIISLGEVRRSAAARSNCDLANIDRAVKASEEHLAAIDLIDQRVGLESLSEKLQTLAHIRRAYKGATLAELARLTSLSKSGLTHRINKLMQIAESLK